MCEPSRFIDEIDPQYLQFESVSRAANSRSLMGSGGFDRGFTGGLNKPLQNAPQLRSLKEVSQSKPSADSGAQSLAIMVGNNVLHDRFGKGKVLNLKDREPIKKQPSSFRSTVPKRYCCVLPTFKSLKNSNTKRT
jgi:DNA helicase-2/ATP-dependent DNA helicase PcrA